MTEIYASELATYRRDTVRFRRLRYILRCVKKGIQPLSRARVNLVQIAAALTLPVLATSAFV